MGGARGQDGRHGESRAGQGQQGGPGAVEVVLGEGAQHTHPEGEGPDTERLGVRPVGVPGHEVRPEAGAEQQSGADAQPGSQDEPSTASGGLDQPGSGAVRAGAGPDRRTSCPARQIATPTHSSPSTNSQPRLKKTETIGPPWAM